MECRLDEHLKFTGKTSDQRKCSGSVLTDAYVDKRMAGKMGSTNHEYQYRPTSAGEKSNLSVGWIGGTASTWFGLRHARLKVVLQRIVVSRIGCSVFEFWVLRFRDLGASCFGLRFRVLRFRNNPGHSVLSVRTVRTRVTIRMLD